MECDRCDGNCKEHSYGSFPYNALSVLNKSAPYLLSVGNF